MFFSLLPIAKNVPNGKTLRRDYKKTGYLALMKSMKACL